MNPAGIKAVVVILREMVFLGFCAEDVNNADQGKHDTGTKVILPGERGAEWYIHKPPSDVFEDIGRMFHPPIGAGGDDAAVGEVGKAATKGHRGPDVNREAAKNAKAPCDEGNRITAENRGPIGLGAVLLK